MRRVADQLGVGVESLRSWLKQHEIDQATAPRTTTDKALATGSPSRRTRSGVRVHMILKPAAVPRARARRVTAKVVADGSWSRSEWTNIGRIADLKIVKIAVHLLGSPGRPGSSQAMRDA